MPRQGSARIVRQTRCTGNEAVEPAGRRRILAADARDACLPDRRIALANLAERTGQPGLKRLAGTIAQTLKYGTPLSQGLRTLAAEMRNERMIQFEERAGKLPALLVLPMILFILPCLFIILMGQPVSQLIGALGVTH